VKRIAALSLAIVSALVLCSTALANSLTSGHGTSAPGNNGTFTPPGAAHGPSGVATGGPGTLPFTGFNLAIIAALALLLIVSGLALRRVARRDDSR
jgi:hypothetical protein